MSFTLDTSYFKGEYIRKLSHAPDGTAWCIKGLDSTGMGMVDSLGRAKDMSLYWTNVTTAQFNSIQAFDSATAFVGANGDYLYEISSNGSIVKFDTSLGIGNKNVNSVLLCNFDYTPGYSSPLNQLERHLFLPRFMVVGTDSGIYATDDFKRFILYDFDTKAFKITLHNTEKDYFNISVERFNRTWNTDVQCQTSIQTYPVYVSPYMNPSTYYDGDNYSSPPLVQPEVNVSIHNVFRLSLRDFTTFGFMYWGTKTGLKKKQFYSPSQTTPPDQSLLLNNQEIFALKLAPFRTLTNGIISGINQFFLPIKKDEIITRYLFVGSDSGFYYGKANYNLENRLDPDTLQRVSIDGANFTKVYDIAVDTSGCGYLWLATDNGLYKLRVNFEKEIIYNAIQPQGRINICDRQIRLNATLSSSKSIQWQKDSTDIPDASDLLYTTTVVGQYRFKVQNALTNTNCYSKEVQLVRDTAVTFTYPNTNQSLCKGDTFKLQVQTDTGYVYAWYRNNLFTGFTDSLIRPTLDGWYDVKVTNCYKRSAFSDSTLLVYSKIAKPDLFSMKTAICVDDSTSLFITATGFNTQWKINGTVDSSYANKINIEGVPFKNYVVYIKDTIGCVANSDIKTIGGISYPSLNLLTANKGILCKGTPLELQAVSSSSKLLWSTGSTTPQITIAEAGKYVVKTWFDTTCKAVDSVKIVAVDPPTFKLKADTVFCFGELNPIELKAPPGFKTYQWNEYKSTSNVFSINNAGLVSLEIADVNNCTVSSVMNIEDKCKNLIVPNIFTPNGDGVNDVFEIKNLIPNMQLSVFNRWGSIVYTSTNYENNWNGGGLNDGLYFYSIYDSFYKNEYKGWLEVMR